VLGCGFDSRVSDEGVFRLVDNSAVIGDLALRLDITLGGGTAKYHEAMDHVSESLKFGAKVIAKFRIKELRYSRECTRGPLI
jgi:hypothetical protein